VGKRQRFSTGAIGGQGGQVPKELLSQSHQRCGRR